MTKTLCDWCEEIINDDGLLVTALELSNQGKSRRYVIVSEDGDDGDLLLPHETARPMPTSQNICDVGCLRNWFLHWVDEGRTCK